MRDVRSRGQSGKHILAVSYVGDPQNLLCSPSPDPFQEPKVPDYDVVPIVEIGMEIGYAPEAWTFS